MEHVSKPLQLNMNANLENPELFIFWGVISF
jgi:hypothetical protein